MFYAIMSVLVALQLFMAAVSFMGFHDGGGWRMAVAALCALSAGVWTFISALRD